jgi:hypothetical protein
MASEYRQSYEFVRSTEKCNPVGLRHKPEPKKKEATDGE